MNILTKTFTEHKKAATIGLISAAVVLSTGVGVACKGYVDNQAKIKQQAIENQKKMEAEKIAKQAAEEESKKKAAAEEAAKLAAASQPAPEFAPALKPTTTTATKPKATTTPTKTETKPTYETVSVSVSAAGVATIGTTKAGTCYFEFKQYDAAGNKINYASASAPASGGTCAVAVPAGTWTKIYVTYKASDYSAKGYGYLML